MVVDQEAAFLPQFVQALPPLVYHHQSAVHLQAVPHRRCLESGSRPWLADSAGRCLVPLTEAVHCPHVHRQVADLEADLGLVGAESVVDQW